MVVELIMMRKFEGGIHSLWVRRLSEVLSRRKKIELSRGTKGYFKQAKREGPGESYCEFSSKDRRSVFHLWLGWEVQVGSISIIDPFCHFLIPNLEWKTATL